MNHYHRHNAPAYGTDKEVVQRMIDQLGGAKRVLPVLTEIKSLPRLYALTDATQEAALTYAQARALARAGATAGPEDLAQLAGGVFLPIPRGTAGVPIASAAAAREFGEAMALLFAALEDGQLSRAEARAALPEIHDALRAIAELEARVRVAAEAAGP